MVYNYDELMYEDCFLKNQNLNNKKLFDKLIDENVVNKVDRFFITDAKRYGFEERIGQQDMALDIAEAIRDKNHFIVEAGVGIGKSFAYIVPLLYYNQYTNKPVIIATSTIALQEQLVNDINTISEKLYITPEIVNGKGQSHYACIRKAFDVLDVNIDEQKKWLEDIESGKCDRSDIYPSMGTALWNKICISKYNARKCMECEFRKQCSFYLLRNEMKTTRGIIVCNQNLLIAHLNKINSFKNTLINDDVSVVVIDEAHNFENNMRNAFTNKYDKKEIIDIFESAVKLSKIELDEIIKPYSEIPDKINSFFDEINQQIKTQFEEKDSDIKYAGRYFFNRTNIEGLIKSIYDDISAIYEKIDILFGFGEIYRENQKQKYAFNDLESVKEFFSILCFSADNYLFWLENQGHYTAIAYCPKNIAEKCNSLLFHHTDSAILTSATIANGYEGSLQEQYRYFINNIGFPCENDNWISYPQQSPFPYDTNAMIYYCSNLPHPTKKRDKFLEKGCEKLLKLLKITTGKALVLFTAKYDLDYVYERISKLQLPFKVLKQEAGSSQEKILELFRIDTDSVLFGTGAYWEGINVSGISLSHLVIFRLPFPVPDPIIDYKRSVTDNYLMNVDVPEMVIKLRQGVGRLIRSETDKGIVSIIDSRLSKKSRAPYKELVWDALPIKNKTDSIESIEKFYNNVVLKIE